MRNNTSHPTPQPRRPKQQRGRLVPSRRRRPWFKITGAIVGALAAIGLVLASRSYVGTIDGVTSYDDLERDHVEELQTYAQTPPVGGVHNARWQNCGIYDQPVTNEHAVHSLEHGAVWITYRPDLPIEAIEQLRSVVREQGYILLSPYDGLPAPVVVSAWGVQLPVERADDPQLTQFIRTYIRGAQTPEPGAACYGGVGQPRRS